jgi:hypothetical protein
MRQGTWKSRLVRHATVAYLTLPEDGISREEKVSYDDNPDRYKWENGYALPVNMGAMPTQMSLRRSPRALKLFDLEVPPDAEPSDSQTSDEVSADSVDTGHELTASRPRLTALTRCVVEY